MTWTSLTGLAIVFIGAGLLVGLTILGRKSVRKFRSIPAFDSLNRAAGLSVEDGTRLHISLGRAPIYSPNSVAGLVGLSVLRRLAQFTAVGDSPAVSTAGDAALAILSQDTIETAFEAAGAAEQYRFTSGRLTGLTPFSYTAGALPVIRSETVSANVLLGHFGPEVALLTDAAERENSFLVAASDDLTAQAVLFAATNHPLVGEELYAAGAYIKAGASHIASLTAQDILRWLVIVALVASALLKLFGVL